MSTNKMSNPDGKYWQNVDLAASWWQTVMDNLPQFSWDSSDTSGDQEEMKDEENVHNNAEKPSVMKRRSTCATVLEDMDLNGDDEEDWETLPSTQRRWCEERLKQMTFAPSFRKRFGICMGMIVLLLVILLVSILASTPASGGVGSAFNATGGNGADTNVQNTGNNTDTGADGTDMDTGGDDTDTGGDDTDTGGDDTNTGGDDTNTGGDDTTSTNTFDLTKPASPFSTLHPVDDLGLFGVLHTRLPPESVQRGISQALPTSAWYENLLVADGEPTSINKAYVIPYLVDAVGPIPGLRVHPIHLTATATTVQIHTVDTHGLTLGASNGANSTKEYSVVSTNPLGLTLTWNALPMTSSIIRGMPYATMVYPKPLSLEFLPMVASEVPLESGGVVVDGAFVVDCTKLSNVKSELKLTFVSDFTWMVFFSEPVQLQCQNTDSGGVEFQVIGLQDENSGTQGLTIRAALLTNCTNGKNAIHCSDQQAPTYEYEELLRERAHLYPGPNADIRYGVDSEKGLVRLDWDVQSTSDESDKDLIMYALPHHLSRMDDAMPWNDPFCTPSLIGSTCVVSGSVWDLEEDLPITSFRAPRPPRPEALPAISEALERDIFYNIPDNFKRGAGDTYFSGKILARVGRVLMIAEELQDLCDGKAKGYDLTEEEMQTYVDVCSNITLPSDDDISASLENLRSAVEVWINGTAEAPFAYDSGWGGVISCGCVWDGDGCSNQLPDCPATSDQGLNFGNGFYSDHHFHYGYHIYAAAAVAHFDRDWGRVHFEDVLLLIRDIANPSSDDNFFPRFRHKDWYQGSSWASGVLLPTFTNGMNQESSSEAIAAYEAVALFGQEMMTAWKHAKDSSKMEVSKTIRDAGMVLAATEIRSANYYWHVRQNDESKKIYPSTYEAGVIGILWSTLAQFTTWFGNSPYLAIGIQLLPLTPISENRDASQEWLREIYAPLANSCAADFGCANEGWGVLQLAILATIGNVDMAMEHAQQIPASAFNSAGGNGHSMTNTLHYMATRPEVEPADVSGLAMPVLDTSVQNVFQVDCGVPDICTSAVLNTLAGGYTCLDRILWLVNVQGITEDAACTQIAVTEYPDQCGACHNVNGRA